MVFLSGYYCLNAALGIDFVSQFWLIAQLPTVCANQQWTKWQFTWIKWFLESGTRLNIENDFIFMLG
jgi:hypothetical protein